MDPPGTLLAVALAMLVALGTIALMQLFDEEPLGNLLHMGEGVWAAYVVAAALSADRDHLGSEHKALAL